MEAMIRGSGRSASFSQKITQFSDLGHDVRRARLIKHFLWVCYNEELSGADLVMMGNVIVRYKRPAGMSHQVAEWSAEMGMLPDRAAACPA